MSSRTNKKFIMKRIFILLAAVLFAQLMKGQGFSKAEYFFDTDPGINNGTAVSLSGTSDTINFNANVSTTSLLPGFHFLALRVKHSSGTWGLFETRGFYISTATADAANISAAEYFFDADPGAGSGIPLSVGASGAIVNFAAVIPQSLPAGFHFIAIRTKGTDGIWGLFEVRGFYISSSTADAANLSAAEYFFDADPGVGNGNALSVGASGAIVNFTAAIPTSLPAGFHFIAIRTKGTDGIWGLYETRGFYISSSTADAANITAAEYFFDADPGIGNGTAASVGASGAIVNFTAVIPTSLPAGFHFLAIRTKGSDGIWGLYETRGFYISTSTADAVNISAAEYFFDADPGVGNGTAASVGASGSIVNFAAAIPTSLPVGFHFLAIRTKGTDGKWGLYESRGFYISQATADMPIITAAEYFFDADPGVGNGTALTVNTPGNTFTQTFNVPVPGAMPDGQHFLAIRVKGQDGQWGLYDFDTLNIGGTIPVTGLFFSAKKEDKKVKLEWYTLTELNTSHYEIERSKNGTDFEKIGQIAAAGNSGLRTDYSFADALPNKSLNYYRLKQFDRDGKFTYSGIRLVKFNDDKQFIVYPTVSSGQFTLSGITESVQVKIFSSSKQLVQSFATASPVYKMNLSALAAGTYWLIIEKDNRILFYNMIIKQ